MYFIIFWEAYSNSTVRPALCPVQISYVLSDRNSKFCVLMHLGWQTVAYHFRVTVTLTSDLVLIVITLSVRPSVTLFVRCISPIFFEVRIPNLMCGCILGWRSVVYHFPVTVTLTSDQVLRIIMSRAYLLYYLR